MTQNKEILDKLIGDTWTPEVKLGEVPTGNDDEVLITTSRVVGVRYKVYSVILVLLLFLLWYNYILPSFDKYGSERIELSNMELQMLNFENKQNQYETNKWLVDKIKQVEGSVVSCVNNLQWCNELQDVIKNSFGIVRSYLLLHEMDNDKMVLDEKTILANLDGFLLKKNPLDEKSRTKNWSLNKIVIGDAEQFKENLYLVPIEFDITFDDKDGLLSFINNVEQKIPTNKDIRMLYKIDKISYDIVNSDQVQDASVFMYLYFYEK